MALRPVSDPALLARLNGGAPQPVQIAPADPRLPAQVQAANLGNQRTQQQIGQEAQLAPLRRQLLQEQIRGAQVNNAKATGTKVDPAKLGQLRALQDQINRVQQLYKTGPGATQGLAGLLDYLPTPANKQFDTAGAGLGEIGLAAFRVPGSGSQSDAELKAFINANRPASSDYDVQVQEKLRNLQNRLNQTYGAMGIKPQGAKPQAKPKQGGGQARVIDFNDLPE